MEFTFNTIKPVVAYKFDHSKHRCLVDLVEWLRNKFDSRKHSIEITNRITPEEVRLFNLSDVDKGKIGIAIINKQTKSTSFKVLADYKVQYVILEDSGIWPGGVRICDIHDMKYSYGYEELPKAGVVIEKPKLSINVLINQQLPHGMYVNSARCADNVLEAWIDTQANCTHSLGLFNFQRILAEYYSDQDRPKVISINFSPSIPTHPNRQHYSVVFKFATN